MLTTKLVIRVMNSDGTLLGWADVQSEARGDGCLWVSQPTRVMIEETGIPHVLSIHWCDVNVETRSVIEHQKPIEFGNILTLPGEWPALTVGPAAGGLPPVTVRDPVALAVPVGRLGSMAH